MQKTRVFLVPAWLETRRKPTGGGGVGTKFSDCQIQFSSWNRFPNLICKPSVTLPLLLKLSQRKISTRTAPRPSLKEIRRRLSSRRSPFYCNFSYLSLSPWFRRDSLFQSIKRSASMRLFDPRWWVRHRAMRWEENLKRNTFQLFW